VKTRVELVVEPRPELPEAALEALRSALAGRDDVARAYLLHQRRSVAGEEPTLLTALSLVPVEPTDEPPREDDVVRLVLAVAAALGDGGARLAIGVPARRALPTIEKYGVLVYEREPL
jgi:hypothetical protein